MDLSAEALKDLLDKASLAKLNSYSPYSKFRVGAALLAKDGQVFMGTNVENASYGIYFKLIKGGTICAERSAFVSAVSCGCKEFTAIMIATDVDDWISPCGFCRQFMVEFGKDLIVKV